MTYYTKDHEWLRVEGDVATVGITGFAAEALGDLVFIEVKPIGSQVRAEEAVAVVESVKAASDIYAPVGGEILEINPRLADEPSVVSEAPEGEGWLFKLRIADPSELGRLLDHTAYSTLAGEA
jgi:glycine cleavage system H protein